MLSDYGFTGGGGTHRGTGGLDTTPVQYFERFPGEKMTGNDGESSHVPPIGTPCMTVFPRAIVDRVQEFAGSHIQGRGSRGGKGRGRRLPLSTPLPEVEPSLQTPTLTSAAHTVTRSIYSFPENVAWKPRGEEFLPFLED